MIVLGYLGKTCGRLTLWAKKISIGKILLLQTWKLMVLIIINMTTRWTTFTTTPSTNLKCKNTNPTKKRKRKNTLLLLSPTSMMTKDNLSMRMKVCTILQIHTKASIVGSKKDTLRREKLIIFSSTFADFL